MAGFLTHIAARLEGTEKMLRPKTPSLFEPEPSVGREAASVLSAAEPLLTEAPGGFEEAQGQTIANTPTSKRYDQDARAPVATGHSIVVDSGPDEHTSQGNQPRIKAPARERHAGLPRGAVADAPAEKSATTPRGENHAFRAARVAAEGAMIPSAQLRPADLTEAAVLARDTRDGAERARPSRATAPDEAVLNRGEDSSEAMRAPALEASGILRAPAIAHIPAAPGFTTPRAQEREPTVHVTIGRVEVRAIAAQSSQPARTERPSPVMSLDEYLRTRAR